MNPSIPPIYFLVEKELSDNAVSLHKELWRGWHTYLNFSGVDVDDTYFNTTCIFLKLYYKLNSPKYF